MLPSRSKSRYQNNSSYSISGPMTLFEHRSTTTVKSSTGSVTSKYKSYVKSGGQDRPRSIISRPFGVCAIRLSSGRRVKPASVPWTQVRFFGAIFRAPLTNNTAGDAAGAGLSVDDVKDLGRIQVNVRRIIRTKRSIALNRDTRPVQPVTEVSEKILKGKAIGNTVRYVTLKVHAARTDGVLNRVCNYIPSTAPPPITHRWRDIEGAGGLPLIFTIFYRSKRKLTVSVRALIASHDGIRYPSDARLHPSHSNPTTRDCRNKRQGRWT